MDKDKQQPKMTNKKPTRSDQGTDKPLLFRDVLDWLVKDGLVDANRIQPLLKGQQLSKRQIHPLELVAEQNWAMVNDSKQILTLEWLSEWLAKHVRLDYFHIDPLKIDFNVVTEIMSFDYAKRFKILPVKVLSDEIWIATAEPFVREWEHELKLILRKEIKRVVANPVSIMRYMLEFYNLARSVKRADSYRSEVGIATFEQLVDMKQTDRQYDANDQHIVTIVDLMWQYAFDQRASDIHVEPRRSAGHVRFRIDGVLHEVYRMPVPVMHAVTNRIKILGRMDVVEKRRPQDGRVKTRRPDGQEIELRLSTLPTAFGEKLVMRIFDPEVLVRNFSELGFNDADKAAWNSMISKPDGIILVTGPTGSGKTTTLYTSLKQLATPEVNVSTIEDPIEMVEDSFNQMQVQLGIDLDFAAGVRALMRQDPDIIMIGEIRDQQTAEMAIQAALTGHLVLSTLHTNDAPSAVTRLIDLGAAPFLLQATLLGVMAQRLLRVLCPYCKQGGKPTPEEESLWHNLILPWKAKLPAKIQRPTGCLECRMTGYLGRVGIYEILIMSEGIKRLIIEHTDLAKLRQTAYIKGLKPLRLSAAMKIAAGLTTFDEVFRVTPPSLDTQMIL